MNPEESTINGGLNFESLLPEELSQDQAFDFLGRAKPPKLEDILPAGSKLSPNSMPDEMSSTEAMEFALSNNLDTNIDPNALPDELDLAQATDLVRKLGTQSIGVGVPQTGSKASGKSSGLATKGFFGALPNIPGGRITQGHNAPVNYESDGKHGGVDIAAPKGTPIPSVEDGVVVSIEDQGKKAFGKSVVIKNSDGSYSRYSHLDSFAVRMGQTIKRGTIIGGMGNTGYVIPMNGGTGVHLDYRRSR